MGPVLQAPPAVRDLIAQAGTEPHRLPAYVYDLADLATHVAAVRAALPPGVELLYASKANPDTRILAQLRPWLDGYEVASGGELAHVQTAVPSAALHFGGPGKTMAELALGLDRGVTRFHVESEHELRLLAMLARARGATAKVLLRVNPPIHVDGGQLRMGGGASPFGMDPDLLDRCAGVAADTNGIQLLGLHAHVASGLDAAAQLGVVGDILAWAVDWGHRRGISLAEVNVGGGMAVDYGDPGSRFDWATFGQGLAKLTAAGRAPLVRIEPGRALTAYCGWYVTRVLDIKCSSGASFAIVQGGTHHLRTPAAKQHDQPFVVIGVDGWPWAWQRPQVTDRTVTVVGQLCTPKDVLATRVPVTRLRAGDAIAFGLAGAYAWNISHTAFLLHPAPDFHYQVRRRPPRPGSGR